VETLLQDFRFGLRMLRKSPGFTAVAVLILALGIGANTAIFSVVDAVLLRPLPVPHSEQLVEVYSGLPLQLLFIRDFPLSHPEYQDLARQNISFSGLLAYHADLFALERESSGQLVPGMLVTGNYFNVLGVKAVLGRTFDAAEVAEPRGYSVAVISHSLWQEQFGSNPNVLGKTIDLNGQLFTVIGIAPASFNGLVIAPTPQIWIPLTPESYQTIDHAKLEDRGESNFWVVGRLKSGQTIQQAQAEISTIAARLAAQYPETEKDHTFRLYPANQVRILPGIDKMLYGASAVLMGVVGLILLIACINMAAMSLAGAASRRKEIAVRLAVGAGRRRLIRQLLTESLLFALAGGAAAVAITMPVNGEIVRALNALPLVSELNLTLGLRVDYRVLVFTLLVVTAATALFGLAPALEASRTTAAEALKDESSAGSERRHRLLSALVVAQVAVSLVLLVCAGLLLRSVFNAYRVDPGFQPQGVVAATLAPEIIGYKPAQAIAFRDTVMRKMKQLPGVASAGFADALPLMFSMSTTNVIPSDEAASLPEKQWPQIDTTEVGPGYFRTMGIPILRGRGFLETDTATAPLVAVINRAFAQHFWPGQDPIGKQLIIKKKQYEVVGVVATGKYRTLGEKPRPFVYRSVVQMSGSSRMLVVRTSGSTGALITSIREIARQIDSKVPVLEVETLTQATAPALLLPKLGADFFGLAGLLGLVLACAGIYGVMAYSVSQRTHEIGICMALGAQGRDVARLVLGRSLLLTLAGVGIGLGIALVVTRVLSDILYGISATDPVTFVAVPALFVLVALAASYIPARRAMRVDPMVALRHE
jgi:predicted permease